MPKDPTLQQSIIQTQHTKNVFQNCERLLRTATFSGKECEQVAECIALMRFMITNADKEIRAMQKEVKNPVSDIPKPVAPVVPDESGLEAHIPE